MKRILIALLLLVLTVACVPTPEQEYVVYKGDRTPIPTGAVSEDTVSVPVNGSTDASDSTVGSANAPAFPARWEEVQNVRGAVVTYRADVIVKEDGRYPLFRIRDQKTDAAWRERILSAVLPKPVEMTCDGITREQRTEEFRQFLAQMDHQRDWIKEGFPEWGDVDEGLRDLDELERQYQEMAESYQEWIANAPESLETVKKTDYRNVPEGAIRFKLETGESVCVSATDRGFCGITVTRYPTWLNEHTEYRHLYPYPITKPYDDNWHDVTMPEDEARAALDKLLNALDLTDFAIARMYRNNLFDGDIDRPSTVKWVAACWCFDLVRSFGGYPVESKLYIDDRMFSFDQGGEAYNAPLMQESLKIMLDETGVRSFAYYNPKEVVGLDSANLELLPFDEAQQRIKTAMSVSLNVDDLRNVFLKGDDPKMQVFRVMLSAYPVRIPNSSDFYAMPCYLVFFDFDQEWRSSTWDQPDTTLRVLIVNASDGSIIHPSQGY